METKKSELEENEVDINDEKEIVESQKKLKKEKKEKSEKEETSGEVVLTSLDDYIKTSSYLGTKVITPTMREYVYRRRLDGLAILNTNTVDKKLKEAIDFIVQFKPEEWIIACKREAGWRPVKMFSELTGVRVFTKKYPAGIITNTCLPNFFETKMVMVCDPWNDKNALNDANLIAIPVVAICDTNNHTHNVDVVAIANNKSNKSIGLIFWLLAREYMKAHGIKKPLPSLEDFVGEKLIVEEIRKKKKAKEKEKEKITEEQMIEDRMRRISEESDNESEKRGPGAEQGV